MIKVNGLQGDCSHALQQWDLASRVNFCSQFIIVMLAHVNAQVIHKVNLTNLHGIYCVWYIGTKFSAPLMIYVSSFCFYKVIHDSYREDLIAFGGKSCCSCRETVSHGCVLLYHCTHCTSRRENTRTREKNAKYSVMCTHLNNLSWNFCSWVMS